MTDHPDVAPALSWDDADVLPVPILSDNYAWVFRDRASGAVGVVDPAEAAPIIAALDALGGRLDLIVLTHHHADHIAEADAVRAHYGARVAGARADVHRLPRLDLSLAEGDRIALGGLEGVVFDTPGHTRGHISIAFPEARLLFCGDTLFSLGCGRLLEGTAQEMFDSLAKLTRLPDDMLVCCGHEYTQSNARFALSVDPGNLGLQARAAEVAALRHAGRPTLPVRLGDEKATNPFLRAPDGAALAALRTAKDDFR